MLLCDHCIRALRSRGEVIYVGNCIPVEEAKENLTPCEWCGEYDDLYECEEG